MVLSKGNVMYSGKGADSLAWFEEHGCELKKEINPLGEKFALLFAEAKGPKDFLVDVTSIDNRSSDREDESRARVATLVQAWKDRVHDKQVPPPFAPAISHTISHTISRGSQGGDFNADAGGDMSRPGPIKQTIILLRRSHLNVYRNYGQLLGFLLQSIGIGFFMGLTYFDLQGNPADIQSLKGVAFQFYQGYFYLTQVYWIHKYCSDFIIFDREREDHLYSTFPYIIADFISYLVPTTVPPTIYTLLLYGMSNMNRHDFAANLFIVIANCICMQWTTQGLALFASSIFRGFPQASMTANSLSLFFILSAGFSLTHVPGWLRWIRYVSPTFYSFRIVATTQFKGRTFSCEGVTGVALTQCDGDNVLRGLAFSLDTPLIVYFAAEIGIIAVLYLLSGLILQFYRPGGMKHAPGGGPESRGEESALTGDMDIVRAKIDVEFRNVGFRWVSSGLPLLRKAEEKTILNDITTCFPAGEISAILGPSGAGKSTLLQLLAHRKLNAGPGAHFEMSGDLLFNGMPATEDVRNSVAFVEQEDDYHLSALTVRETLRYAAILRLPPKMSRKRKIARAEEVLSMLGLRDCADIFVGGELLKGISGGEKRRLSLAVQMISDPSVLVVDEPTSGLDSFIANNVMECLKEIARSGRTVIVSIHQPRSDIFHSLDNLLILAKGGHAVFSGKRERAVHIMESQGYPLPSLWFNPADHLLDLVTVDQRSGKTTDSRVDRVEGHQKSEGTTLQVVHESRSTPIQIAFPVVAERMLRNLWRQKDAFWGRLTQPPLAGILLLMFYERLRFGPTGGQDRIGVTLQSTGTIPFIGLISGIAVFPQDRQLFMHEYRSSAAYSCTTLILAYTLIELPSQIFAAILYAVFMNVAVGMQTNARIYFEYAVTIVVLQNMGESIAIIFSAFFDALGFAVSLVSTTLTMVVQFSGILSLSVPFWLSVIAWGTPLKPTQHLQFINECEGLQFHCTQDDITSGVCTAQSGEQLLNLYSFNDRNTAKLVGVTISAAIAWRLLAWAALRARVWQE
ncbi:Pleiotropic drug resistance proteins (PDR1-15), ABC superfamily [Mycena sanguinolenta]|uniref:Pleiotropic drug resistance proteins (PDR1-15), ABC superfamily n=1 Tax=Mycena sanguinolenta TaxID=230812 RepID=A0A8H6YVV5_9AGAR|nr:Pleiotropic drug resistance proteins (PDR1-15), ABC superfamily [Mycena sanguinolenta]